MGMLAVDAAKKSERHTCPPSEPGKRRRRTACARDVAGWLWRTYRVKFCFKTVTADLRVIKKKTMSPEKQCRCRRRRNFFLENLFKPSKNGFAVKYFGTFEYA